MLTNKIDDPNLSNLSKNQLIAAIFCLILFVFKQIIFNTEWYLGELISRDSTVNDIGMLLLTIFTTI